MSPAASRPRRADDRRRASTASPTSSATATPTTARPTSSSCSCTRARPRRPSSPRPIRRHGFGDIVNGRRTTTSTRSSPGTPTSRTTTCLDGRPGRSRRGQYGERFSQHGRSGRPRRRRTITVDGRTRCTRWRPTVDRRRHRATARLTEPDPAIVADRGRGDRRRRRARSVEPSATITADVNRAQLPGTANGDPPRSRTAAASRPSATSSPTCSCGRLQRDGTRQRRSPS